MTVRQEAAGEPYKGKVAVAEVILRRTKLKYRSDGTVAGTVLWGMQFSGWNGLMNNKNNLWRITCAKSDTDDPVVKECTKAWVEAAAGSNLAPGCVDYYNPTLVTPDWAVDATVVADIGKHRFVIPKKGG